MRAKEIFEQKEKTLHKGVTEALPPSIVIPGMDPYYEFYRFVISLAGFPGNDDPNTMSVVRDHPIVVPYSKQELEAVEKILKKHGKKAEYLTTKPSTEQEDVQKVSPVRPFKDYSK